MRVSMFLSCIHLLSLASTQTTPSVRSMMQFQVAKNNYTEAFDAWLRTQQTIRDRLAHLGLHEHQYTNHQVDRAGALEAIDELKTDILKLQHAGIRRYKGALTAYEAMVKLMTDTAMEWDRSEYALPMCGECHNCFLTQCANKSATCYKDDCSYAKGDTYTGNCFDLGC